jgi:hypothetical protein
MKIHWFILLSLMVISNFNCDPKKILQDKEPPEAGQIDSDDEDGDFKFEPGTRHLFWINAKDPEGKYLVLKWQIIGGELIGRTDNDTVLWQLPSIGGNYTISVKISNDQGETSRSREVTVLSYEKPVVKIARPQDGDFIVQHSITDVEVTAFHELGIRLLQFYINDSLISRQEGKTSGDYIFSWNVIQDTILAEIKVTAISMTTAVSAADSITVNIEGFILGKPVTEGR